MIIIIDIVSIGALFLCAISNVWVIILARFINGITVGINSALVPIFINEVSPTNMTGRTGSLNQAMINVGVIVSNLLGLVLPSASADDIVKDDIS